MPLRPPPPHLPATAEEDESLEILVMQLLCNLSSFKNNQQKLGEWGARNMAVPPPYGEEKYGKSLLG